MNAHIPSYNNRLQIFLLVLLLLIIAWSWIDPHDRFTWWMETFPVLIVLPVLIVSRETFRLSCLLYWLIFAHCSILLIGAHYTYAEVPAGAWAKEYFGFQRNHYDRLGHVMQGLVPAIGARELLIRTSDLKRGKWMFVVVIFGCLGVSAIYEIIEWVTAAITGEGADAFLGTQGDPFDTQKDMAFAGLGAVLGYLLLARFHDRSIKNIPSR